MNSLFVVALLIIGVTAHDFGSFRPSDYGAWRGGPHGARRPPHGRPFGPPHAPRGKGVLPWGIPLNPNNTSSLQFTAVFRADNITLQNNTTLPLKEGESIFLLPRPQGPPPKYSGKPPQAFMSYVKIQYNSNSTTPLSIEYGVTQLSNALLQSFKKFGSESDEDFLQ